MDYFDVFRNLKGNYRYSRKSPEKAVLLLAVINLFEQGKISDNEIRYNDDLKSEYLSVWNQFVSNDSKLYSDAYVAFWYLEGEKFWHTITKRKHSELIKLMRDEQIKPSETMILECVDYAELDDDLYFLMTMRFGRTELRAALMESSFDLSDEEIRNLKNNQNKDDCVENADFNKQMEVEGKESSKTSFDEMGLGKLSIDTQIVLNFEYYSFLKNNRYDRDWFLELFPNIESLYPRITDRPLTRDEINPAFIFTYREFLFDLRINLMSDNDATELINSIDNAINLLDDVVCDSEENVPVLNEDDVMVESNTISEKTISEKEDKPEYEDFTFYAKPIEKTEKEKQLDFFVENTSMRSYICNHLGERVYSDSAKLKIFHGKPYRFNYKPMCLSVKSINRIGENWEKGGKVLAVYSDTDLYKALNEFSFIEDIEDFIFSYVTDEIRIKVRGQWYDYYGKALSDDTAEIEDSMAVVQDEEPQEISDDDFEYEPKGNLKKIKDCAKSPYDLLFALAVVDMMDDWECDSNISLDMIACKMIANAWQIIYDYPEVAEKQEKLNDCIHFLLEESKEHMDAKLESYSSSKEVFDAIKDYPIAGVFEDTIEELLSQAPYNVLKAWLNTDDKVQIMEESCLYFKSCLYSINVRRHDSFIVINPKWKNALIREHDNLVRYFSIMYRRFVLSDSAPKDVDDIELALQTSADLLSKANPSRHYFYVKSVDGALGKGYYDTEEHVFILLAGSMISVVANSSFRSKPLYDTIVKEKCDTIGGRYILRENETFATASQASSVVLGRFSNGWKDWVDDRNKTLESVYRNT